MGAILVLPKRKEDRKMVEQDTIRLLRECDAGVKMGVSSIDDVLGYVKSEDLKNALIKCKDEHEKLNSEIQQLLEKYHDDGKEPNPIAKGMSWMKTNIKLTMHESDHTISDLMTDGCDMGIKSLHKYMNKYKGADAESKSLAKRLVASEEYLELKMREFL